MMRDVLAAYPDVDPGKVHVVHNGIDTTQYAPDHRTDVLRRLGIDPDRPSVVYVGRITRQKGLVYLLRAAESLPAGVQLVLLAGAPDTPEIAREVEELAGELSRSRGDVVWVEQMLPRPEVIQVLTQATVFVCPSIYEPMGIVNLEAMACETAVVATATGGIPEVVADGSTGLLVPIAQAADGSGTPLDPARFVADLAAAIADVLADPDRARAMGQAGRQRAVEHFSWSAIAQRTLAVYQSVLPRPRRRRAAGADPAGAKATGAKTTAAKTTGAKTTGARTTGAKATGAKATGAKATGSRAAGTKAAGTKATGTKATATKAAGTTAAGPRRRPAQPRTPR
jgi:alpha-maltose-1-phosphate synthase